jgi:N utilization substance protein B
VGRRSKARECALQMLYQCDVTGAPIESVIASFWRVRTATEGAREMAERLARGATRERERLDRAIAAAASHWRLERIATIERNVLRLGAYELIMEPRTPPSVVIDEAVEIAKRYGEAESSAFVNGVLDSIRRSEHGEASVEDE